MRILAVLLSIVAAASARGDTTAELLDERGKAIALRVAEAVGIQTPAVFSQGGQRLLQAVYASSPAQAPEDLRFAATTYRLVQAAIAQRRPTIDEESHWLVEGLSYALVEDIVREELGDDAAASFKAQRDPTPFAALKPKSNLAYWPAGNGGPPPLNPAESRLAAARIAFALDEARRLAAGHDGDLLAEALTPSDQPTILDHAAQITGIDLRDRLRAYQSFDTAEQGVSQALKALKAARESNRHEESIGHALRMMEIARDFSPKRYALLAALLHEADRDDEALALLQQRAKTLNDPEQRAELNAVLMDYAKRWGKIDVANAAAEEVLTDNPDDLSALGLRMRRQLDRGKLIQAKVTAQRIVALNPDEAEARRVIDEVSTGVGLPTPR